MQVLAEGRAPYLPVDPDGYRAWVRDNKSRALESKLMTEQEAISKFVKDGDYICLDCNYFQRGPASLLRELMRQRRKDLWFCGKFTWVDLALLIAVDSVSKVDCGFFLFTKTADAAIKAGKVTVYEYSNIVMTARLEAGAKGLPFMPVRSFGGTDGFTYSGAKIVTDPFTNKPLVILPALNPDVALIHAHQADIYGNTRIFGTGVAHVETALASKRVIISAEEIIDTEEIRRDPGRTSIPYYAVDAVVHAPFGAFPGTCGGYYTSDTPHILEVVQATMTDVTGPYLEKYVDGVKSHEEFLQKHVGEERMAALRAGEVIKEGYRP